MTLTFWSLIGSRWTSVPDIKVECRLFKNYYLWHRQTQRTIALSGLLKWLIIIIIIIKAPRVWRWRSTTQHNMAPPYLSHDFHWTDEAESMQRLRSGSQRRLIVPRTRLRTIGDRCFRVMAARAWNSLPTSITTATFLFSFKRQLKTFLFTKSFPEL